MYPVDIEGQLAAMAPEVFDGSTLIVLLPIHGYRNHSSLVPVGDVPGAWPTDGDVTTQREKLGLLINHDFGIFDDQVSVNEKD